MRRSRRVLLAWLLLTLLGFAAGSLVFGRLTTGNGSSSAESVRGADLLGSAASTGARLYGLVDGGRVDDPAVRQSVTAAAADLRRTSQVARVVDAYDSPLPRLRATDGSAGLVVVDLEPDVPQAEFDRAVAAVRDRLHAVSRDAPVTVAVGGNALINDEVNAQVQKDTEFGEFVALPITLVVMVVVFGGLVAAGLPFLGAVASIAGALLTLLGFSTVVDLDPNVVSVVTVMGLGLSIDYSLLIVSRYREERGRGREPAQAIERTVQTAGRTITFSALVVSVSLAGLLVFDDPTYRAIGAAGVSVVVIALAAGLTLVPALLAAFGRRISVPTEPVSDEGRFARLTRRVQRRPLLVTLVVAGLLAVTAAPFLGARFQNSGAALLPKSFESRRVADALASRFPGGGTAAVTVVARVDRSAMAAYAQQLQGRPGVLSVTVRDGLTGEVGAVDLVPTGTDQGPAAQRLVRSLRAERPFPTYVTGEAAFLVDFKESIRSRIPWAAGMVALATFVLLFLMTGSVLVPAKALVMNVLSLGCSFGALVLIFQDGHLSSLLGFTPTGGLETWVPVIVFAFAFGLSMDYEVFLLSRVKELHDEGLAGDDAVAVGLQRSGRIITLAALLVVIVFSGFAAGKMVGIKQMGVALAIAVLVDATLVRCLLVPATMTLLGERNWWAPAPLRRLHDRIGLREAPAADLPEPRSSIPTRTPV